MLIQAKKGLALLIAKLNEVISFMNNNFIYIGRLQETHLTKNQQIKSQGYTTLRKNRSSERKAGGVALIINNNIKYCGISFPEFLSDVDIIGINVRLNNTKTKEFSYLSQRGYQKKFLNIFQGFVKEELEQGEGNYF